MAGCDLKILLDNPETQRRGGEPVTGTIVIRTTATVKCKGLIVTSYWSTHGRGNIAKGNVEQQTLFQGSWDADQEYRYPFKMATASWPPTYYGTYLNVSHFIEAKASLPWASDPKQQLEFPVVATTSPEDLQPTVAAATTGIGTRIFLGILATVFLIPLLFFATFLLPIILIIAGLYWFFRVFLPKQMTGVVECSVEPLRLGAGESLRGSLRFTPKRDLPINSICWTITCVESCSSGTGSNRTTHRHEISRRSQTLHETGVLSAGKLQVFEFSYSIPGDAPPSLKFSDNELNWVGEVRIDIPRWPDYVKEYKLIVAPNLTAQIVRTTDRDRNEDELIDEEVQPVAADSTASTDIFQGTDAQGAPGFASVGSANDDPGADEDLSFPDVVNQILQTQTDPAKLHAVVDAINGLVFAVRADLQGRMYQTSEGMPERDGQWILARHRGTELALCLLWPSQHEPPRGSVFDWQGTATVVGYDDEHDRLLLAIVE